MSSLYTRAVSSALFPLHERLKGHSTVSVHRKLECSQWLPPNALQVRQLEDMREFLKTIGTDVPYYRMLFAKLEFDPDAVRSLADLEQLPLLDKATIRANTEAMIREGATKLASFSTGGSSGEPLTFYLGRERVSHDIAAKWRATRWWGVDIGDPEIVVWGSPIELGRQDRVRLWRDRLFRTRLLSAFAMSPERMTEYLNIIRRRRPAMLFAYPSSLALLAEFARSRCICMDDLGIRVAFTTAECLYDHQRALIEEIFGCPVANGYGGRDAGFIAHQCPRGSMHLTTEDIIVEVVDGSGQPVPAGSSGEIVVTHLRTGVFPFLRYRTGDVGSLASDSCPCGRGLPTLKNVEGRTTDFVVAQDGTVLHGLSLIYVLREMPSVRAFRIVQESLTQLTVLLVRGADFDDEDENRIRHAFRVLLGAGVDIDFDYVDEIPAQRSGKLRYVVSHVEPFS
jgi:phenylacetate-CoA ligase